MKNLSSLSYPGVIKVPLSNHLSDHYFKLTDFSKVNKQGEHRPNVPFKLFHFRDAVHYETTFSLTITGLSNGYLLCSGLRAFFWNSRKKAQCNY